MSESEISLLSKGLKFIPTPKSVNRVKLKEELEVFGRKLRLKWHFRNEESTGLFNPFRRKSKFNPKGKDAAIEIYLSRLEEEILGLDTKLSYSNLSREEKQAMQSLRDDSSIVIKEADKGSAVVVWDREDYLQEASRQLGEEITYEKILGDCVSPLISTVKNCLLGINKRGDISKETLDYFLVENPRMGRFYMLPKIHKRLFDVPGRPVISNSGYFTENISAFVDYHLQPLARQVKSYVKDTNDFLRKLHGLKTLPKDFLMCTIDVVGLYPNIPHDEGIAAVKEALERREEKNISTESLLELTELVLKNNIFEHNGEFFKQKQGTAIGTKMAPPYAILFMDDLENKILEGFHLQPYVWWRYIDDIFLIWQHGEESLKQFLGHLNSSHPSIKFTSTISNVSIDFLDVKVIRHGEKLVTDLFVKSTDTHQYLHASSCHVYHSKRSIPYSQALRLNRICSDPKSFDLRCNQLESWLDKRGYGSRMVRDQVLKARKFSRSELLYRDKPETKAPGLILNITYHPAFGKIKQNLSKIHLLLTPDSEHRDVFQNIPIVGFKRGKSLKDFLVRAKLPKTSQSSGECKGCGAKRCGVCKILKNTNTFESKNGKQYSIRSEGELNCSSKCVVYLVTCKICKIQYVGSTDPPFRLRVNNYKACYRKHILGKLVPQASFHAHFAQEDHNGMDDWDSPYRFLCFVQFFHFSYYSDFRRE